MLDLLAGVGVGHLRGGLQGATRVVDVGGVGVQACADYSSSLHHDFVAVSGGSDNAAEYFTREDTAQVQRVVVDGVLSHAVHQMLRALEGVSTGGVLLGITLITM